MGHANLSTLSTFFVRRLYAKGQLSIHDCIAAMMKAGEALQASEGAYTDESGLGIGMTDIIHYLTRADPTQHGYLGPQGGGPWIDPVLTAWRGGRRSVTNLTARMLDELERWNVEQWSSDLLTVGAVSDRLEEEGHKEWASIIRGLVRQRQVYSEWMCNDDDNWDWGEEDSEGYIFDHIPWRFASGKRKLYPDGIPILANVTH